MNEIQVTENNVVEGAAEAMESTSSKGWIVPAVIAGAAVVAGVVCLVVKAVKAKKAQNAIEAPNDDYETDEFVEAE